MLNYWNKRLLICQKSLKTLLAKNACEVQTFKNLNDALQVPLSPFPSFSSSSGVIYYVHFPSLLSVLCSSLRVPWFCQQRCRQPLQYLRIKNVSTWWYCNKIENLCFCIYNTYNQIPRSQAVTVVKWSGRRKPTHHFLTEKRKQKTSGTRVSTRQ